MDLHKETLGMPVDTIRPKTVSLLLRAAVFFVAAAAFMIFLFDFRAFASGIGFARAALPLLLPLTACGFGLMLVNHTAKRVILYEKGIVYHTAWFELIGAYSDMKYITLTRECGREHSQSAGDYSVATALLPVTTLTILFRDEKRWVFSGSVFADLDEKGEKIRRLREVRGNE